MQRKTIIHVVLPWLAFFVACSITAAASAQTRTLRIVTYNIEADTGGYTAPRPGLITPSSGGSVTNGGVLEGIGEEILGSDPAQPIDILALQETTSNPTTVQPILDGLNAFCSSRGISAVYAMSGLQLTSTGGTGGGPNALVYNTNTVQLLESVGIGTPSGSGEARQVGRYLFAPAGMPTNALNLFYVYVSHYKSGTDSSSLTRRTIEAGIIHTNSATLPANSRVLYVGDYNISTSTETSYQNIVSTTLIGIQGFDPFNPSGTAGINWTVNSLLSMKTESATSLHYRDDLEVMSSNVYYSVAGGLAYVSGTYHSFGNNGTTPYESSVNNSSNTSLSNSIPTNAPISASQLYQDLTTATDHLPVVADYTIPVPPASPSASFTGNPTNGTAPLVVTFTDTSTGNITNRFWDFGDTSSINTATNTVTHTYAAGVYTVTLIATGSGGSSTNTQPNNIAVLTPFQVWQIQYFGSTNNPAADPGADPDGDGFTNLQEFMAGTDPTNSASAFRILSITAQGNDMLVTWQTGVGRTNALQFSSGDASGGYSNNFVDLFTVTNTVGAITNYLDVGAATNSPTGYYRIRLVP
jgi:PKD repeat protein